MLNVHFVRNSLVSVLLATQSVAICALGGRLNKQYTVHVVVVHSVVVYILPARGPRDVLPCVKSRALWQGVMLSTLE